MAGLYDNTGFVPSWARARMAAEGVQPYDGEPVAQPLPQVVSDYSNNESQIARGIRSAFSGAKASLQGFGGMGAELVGADEYAQQLYADAVASQQAAEAQAPRVRTIRQVMESDNPLSSGVDYLAGTAGQVAPYMLLSGAGALLGRGAGLAGGLRAGLSGEALAARAATGAGWGGTAAIHPVMAGDQAVQLHEDPAAAGMSVGERALRANAVGALQAGANALAPAAMVNQTFSGARQALAPRIFGNMALEGFGEGGEEVVNQAHRTTYDPNFQMDPELIGENAAAGFFGAAPVAGVHGVGTHMAHAGIDATVDGAKALGAGAQWVGEQAYQNMPPQARAVADAVANGVQMTKEAASVLAPHMANATDAAKSIVAGFYNDTKDNIKQYREDALADAPPSIEDVLMDLTENSLVASEQAKLEGKKIADDLRNDPAIPDTIKSFVAGSKSKADELAKTAEAFSDLSKWVGDTENMTVEKLQAIDSAAQQPQRLRRYAEEISNFIDETGQDTPAAQELRQYVARMAKGEDLSADDVRNFWLKSRLAAEVERNAENLDALLNAKGVKMAKQGGKVTVENLSRQSTVFNQAIKEALGNATSDKQLINAIANSIQVQDVVGDAQKTVREKVTKALASFGIDPKADNTFTRMYDAVLSAVNEQVSALKEEGVVPAIDPDDVPDAFKADVRNIFTELLQTTDAGREMAGSDALVTKYADGLVDYMSKLASGELGEGAAVKLRHTLERTFGKEKDGIVDQTVERLVNAASAAFGGVDNDTAERVHALVNLNQTLAQKEASIRRLIKFDVGEGRKLRGEIDNLLGEIEQAREYDAKRAELPTAIIEAQKQLRGLPQNSDEAYRIRQMLGKLHAAGLVGSKESKDGTRRYVLEEGVTGFRALKQKWVKEGVVSARNFDALVESLESYSGNPERLTRPEKRVASHETSANHAAEDENDFEAMQDSAAADEDGSISNFDLDGKRTGDERQEYLEKRRRDKYGQDVTESKAAKPIYWGTNAFEAGAHDGKVSAPVSRHESGDRQKASSAPGTEYNAMVDQAYAKYGHRVTDGHPVSVQRWAAEMADATGKSERQLMAEAMQALLAHDQKRLENPKTSEEDKKWIKARAELAERLGSRGDAGEKFFQNSINKNYSYYKMKPSDGTNLSYSRDYLERTAALRTNGTHTDDVGVYVERMQKRHPGKFSDRVYERSLLELTTSDGKTITVDVPKLVREAMQRHQAAETKGLGEKGVEPNLAEDIVTTFHNVMAALMTTDGIKEVGSLFESEDARGKVGTHFDPNLVIFVDPDGKMLQQGEHVLSHSVKRAFTLGDLTKIAGVDPETMRTKYKEQALFSDADLGTIVRSERRADKPNSRDELGVAVGGATQDGKRVSVDYHQLLSRMLERNGIDPHQALQQETLPEKLAAALLREGLAELRARGIEGDAVDNAAAKFNNLVVYHKQYGEESYPVTLNQLRKHLTNEGLAVPRNLRDAKVQELVEKLEQANKLEKTLEERKARRALTLADKDGANAAVRQAIVDDAYDKSNFDYGTPEGEDYSGAKWRQKAEGSRIADGRVINGAVVNERERGDGPKFSQDEGENMRIQQILKELGEGAQGDTPLFDKTEAMGARYGGKEWVRQQRPVDEVDGEVRELPELPDYVASLRERLMEMAEKDPSIKKFLEDTFDMPFLEGDKMSKPFSKYMEERTAKRNELARRRNELTPNIVEAKKSAKPLTLAEQRANAKLTTETLGTVGHDEMRTTREDAAVKARAELRDNPTFGDKEDLDAYEAGVEEAAGAKATFEPEAAPKTEAKADPKPAALDLTATGSRLEATRYLNSLDDAALKQALVTLPAEPPAGSYAAHLRKELTKPAPVMKEWVDGILKRAGVTADELGASMASEAPFSRQRTVETPRAGAAKLDELTAEVDRLLGEGKVTLEMPFEVKDASGKGVSGKYDDQLKKILVSAVAADRMGTAWHETWHRVEDLLGDMGEHGKRVLDEVHKFVSTPLMQKWLQGTYNGDEGVLSQLDTPSERAAFAFQMFMHGAKMPMADKTTFERVKGWVKKLFEKLGYGTTTNEERGKNFFQYVKDGGFARDVENAASVRKGLGEKKGDNLLRAAAQTVKPVMEGLEKVFGHTSDRIRNLEVPEFTKILEAYSGEEGKGGIQLDMARNRLKFMNMVGDILGGKTPEEQYDIFAKDGLKTVLEGITKYLKDAGVPENTRLNMIHRVEAFNSELINDNFEGFVTDLVQHGGFKGKAGEARKIASTIVDRGYFYDPDIKLFENRADLAEKWMERGMLDKMMRYIDRATHVAEHTRAFGQVKEYETPEGRKYKQAEKLHDLLAAGDEKAKPEGRKLIRDFIAAQNGTLGGQMSPEMKKLFGGLLFVQNVHILPAMVFSQMLEPMQLALRKNSLSGSMDSLFRGIRDLPRAFKSREKDINRDYWEKLAYQVGSAPTRIINGVMQDLMNGITMGGTVGELNNRFFRFNGMEQWNRSMHVEATRHAVEFLREHKENVEQKKGDTDKNGGLRSERFLRELGVQASDIKFNGAGELILDSRINPSADKVERAIVQWVEEAMAHPDAGSNPLWMNDPRWALISQMKRFTFANAKFVLGRGMKELKLGNAFPVAPAMLAMPWMMAADGLRDALTGSAGYQAKGALDYAQHAMERANLFGRGQFGLDTVDAVARGGSPVEALGGPTVEMFGNIARGAHNGQLIDTLIDYSPAGGVINALS